MTVASTPLAPAAPARPRSQFVAIFVYTLQSCFPRKRWAAVLIPSFGALLFGLLAYAVHPQPDTVQQGGLYYTVPVTDAAQRAFAAVAADGIFGLVIPIAALIIGDSVLGAEVRAGTFHFTWLSPAPAWKIVLGRWLGGTFVALVTIAPAVALAAILAGSPNSAFPGYVAAAVGSAAYVAVFITIAALTRRTAVWSLAFVFLVERLLGTALTGIAQLSPTWESRAIFLGLLDDVPREHILRTGIPQGGNAIVRLAIVTVVVLAIAIWRIRHMRWAGAAD
jgi:ABC-type transport system involved in multi-copper enzyme maturation permease subunit